MHFFLYLQGNSQLQSLFPMAEEETEVHRGTEAKPWDPGQGGLCEGTAWWAWAGTWGFLERRWKVWGHCVM